MKSRLHLPKISNQKSIQMKKKQSDTYRDAVPRYQKNILKNVLSGDWNSNQNSPHNKRNLLPRLVDSGNQVMLSTNYSKEQGSHQIEFKNYQLSINNSTVYAHNKTENSQSPKKTNSNFNGKNTNSGFNGKNLDINNLF